jgi:hypothetical protein
MAANTLLLFGNARWLRASVTSPGLAKAGCRTAARKNLLGQWVVVEVAGGDRFRVVTRSRRSMLAIVADVTHILNAIEQGAPHAAAELLPLVYDELRRLAATRLADGKPGQTLQPTALVHEAYVRLIAPEPDRHWNGRGHFFAAESDRQAGPGQPGRNLRPGRRQADRPGARRGIAAGG